MCFFRLEIKPLSRTQGRNALAASAYRSGQRLVDDCDYTSGIRKVFDYSRRSGVAAKGVLLPVGAPRCFLVRQTLWHAVEKSENRKNSRVAREALISLPHQLSDKARQKAVETFCRYLVHRYGVGIDYAVHRPDTDGDARNHHAHILMTTRVITSQGLGQKIRVLDDKRRGNVEIHHMRRTWEEICNHALRQAQRPERVCRMRKDTPHPTVEKPRNIPLVPCLAA